ncbi:MAG: hypothetical protein KJ069_29210 [Anaerolineae bacterium]|nr:hypothetical protein [Anaerolineae bacterium]
MSEIVLTPPTEHTKITLFGTGLQKFQALDVAINVEATVNLDAATARRRATAWLASEVGNQLISGTPQLIIRKETVWRMPVMLTSSATGMIGEVGSVDVNAETGELLANEELRDQILANVQHLTRSALSPVE